MPQNHRWRYWSLAALGLGLAVVIWISANVPGSGARPRIAYAENTTASDALASPFKAVYEAVQPAVVGIEVTTTTRVMNGRIMTATSFAGSGVVISEDGVVLTNYHVIDGAEGLYVLSGEDEFPAELIAGDERGHSDALLGVFAAIAPVAAWVSALSTMAERINAAWGWPSRPPRARRGRGSP